MFLVLLAPLFVLLGLLLLGHLFVVFVFFSPLLRLLLLLLSLLLSLFLLLLLLRLFLLDLFLLELRLRLGRLFFAKASATWRRTASFTAFFSSSSLVTFLCASRAAWCWAASLLLSLSVMPPGR